MRMRVFCMRHTRVENSVEPALSLSLPPHRSVHKCLRLQEQGDLETDLHTVVAKHVSNIICTFTRTQSPVFCAS
jgi:hypothetical protein